MFRKLLREQSGYSLVEVIVSIFILAIAIIPMVSMFDMGLGMATKSGNYDTARAFANTKLEQTKSLTYTQVRDNFPRIGDATPSPNPPATISTEAGLPSGFSYSVTKRYLIPPDPATTGSNTTLTEGTIDMGLIEVTVTIRWGSNSYSTTGLVSRGTL